MTAVERTVRSGLVARVEQLRSLPIVRKFFAYFLVGGTCALIDIALFWAFWQLTGLRYAAFAFSFLVSTGINYYLSVRFVFVRKRRSRQQAVALVYVASAIAVAVNLAVFSATMEILALHPVIAKIGGIGAGFGWNFGSRYFWIFRHRT